MLQVVPETESGKKYLQGGKNWKKRDCSVRLENNEVPLRKSMESSPI